MTQQPIQSKKRILIYAGVSDGIGVAAVCSQAAKDGEPFTHMYLFEPLPEKFAGMKRVFNYNCFTMLNVALAEKNETVPFHVTANFGSSSLGHIKKDNKLSSIAEIKTIQVQTINLLDFCKEAGIDYIDVLILDCQGADLMILRTMKEYIDQKRIGKIQAETAKDRCDNIYDTLPSNSFSGFKQLLGESYILAGRGWVSGLLPVGVYETVPDEWDEEDTLWMPS
jgi:FkbM family methyltransferase